MQGAETFTREVDGIFERAERALGTLQERSPEQRLSISVGSDHAWYFAPKIRDFLALTEELDAKVERAVALNRHGARIPFNAPWEFWNLFGEQAVFLLRR